jgi:hypothetical protein
MKILHTIFITSVVLFAACGSRTKKIILYANNNVVIDENAKTIVQKDVDGHVDKEIQFSSGGEIDLKVQQKDGGQSTIALPESGYYIVNVKTKDTIVGGLQKYSTPEKANRVMTQEELQHNIDSLEQMIQGKNTNEANHTFFILPNSAARFTENTNATVVGPYHRLTTIEQKGSKAPEVYRFYSIHEVRETIDKLKKLTGETPGEGKDSTNTK